jgi:hypothetical protein
MEIFEQELLSNVREVVAWCRAAGIQRLTVFDREGESPPYSAVCFCKIDIPL